MQGVTICCLLRGVRNKVDAHMPNRGKDIREETLKQIDLAIAKAKRMNQKLIHYKEIENGKRDFTKNSSFLSD